jgi:hypothetical protein
MTVIYASPSQRRQYPNFIGFTRINADGSQSPAQLADERALLRRYPGAVARDWSLGLHRLGQLISPTQRLARVLRRLTVLHCGITWLISGFS